MEMDYKKLENQDILTKDGLSELISTLTTFNAEVVEVEEFNFNNGEKIYFAISCNVPEYHGTQFDDGTTIEYSVPSFSTVKIIEGKFDYGKYWWTVKEITVEELGQFYSNIDRLRECNSLAGETALPYYMGEDSSFHYFNKIHKEWNRIFG